MQTEKILYQYKLLLEKLQCDKRKYLEKDLCIFNFAKGAKYKNTLLIVGRAVNGWNKYNKHDLLDILQEIENNIETDDLQWVIDSWGINDGKYNTKKSAFWRVAKKLAIGLLGEKEDVINYVAWTNLYKVSNAEGGNPSGPLMNVQFEICKLVLMLEIELLKPKVIIFLTSLGWAQWFLDNAEIKKLPIDPDWEFVEFVGKLNNTLMIVGQHPQGKPEKPHCDEILGEIMKIKV